MHIEFAADDEKFLKDAVQHGLYRIEAEAVRDAVRRVREDHELRQTRLIEALRRGEESFGTGSATTYGPTFMAERMERARSLAARGIQPDPDILP